METNINAAYLAKIRENKRVRQRLAFESPLWFSLFYLRHHFSYPLAPFHIEMFYLIEQEKYSFIVVMAFRESGKSTVMNMANVLWSILGKPGKKFAIIMSNTQEQSKNHFTNIKAELENNEALKEDFGPFTENKNEWNKLSLELEYHGSKIMSVTRDQGIRGLKHNQYRPDLIICDDLEDSSSAKDETISKAFFQRFEEEILPLGNSTTKIIILGNLLTFYWDDQWLNRRSFILRLRDDILNGRIKGIFRAYPLIDDRGKNLWPGRFKNRQVVLKLREKLSLGTWIQEYLFKSYGQNNETGPNIQFFNDRHGKWLTEKFPMRVDKNRYPKQKSLIPQMKEFIIRAPQHFMEFFYSPDDPEYRAFLKDRYFYPNKESFERKIAEDRKHYNP